MINVVPPSELHELHLVAEYRELPRVFKFVRKAIVRGHVADDFYFAYRQYTLSKKGHVKFFYSRLQYIVDRHVLLVFEMKKRGMNPQYTDNLRVAYKDIPLDWYRPYNPTRNALAINRQRLLENQPKELSRFHINP